MYNKIIIFFCLISFSGCNTSDNDSAENQTKSEIGIKKKIKINLNNFEKPFGNIYRSDGFSNDLNSEWFQIGFDDNTNRILGIWYWNTINKNKKNVEIKSQNLNEGEISLISGEIIFHKEIIPFEIIEDRFMIHNENKKQTFDYEKVEENEL